MAYKLSWTARARRQLSEGLPGPVAAAVIEFIHSALLVNPHRVGKRLQPPRSHEHSARRGTYRIIYIINDEDETILITDVNHRRHIYFT